jgi:hypothetical protein
VTTTTTTYGTWSNRADDLSTSVEHTVYECLGDYASDYDPEAIAAEYRAAINDALPPSVSLCGDEFIGPYYAADCNFDGYPLDEFGALDITTIVEQADLWAIIARHGAPADAQPATTTGGR